MKKAITLLFIALSTAVSAQTIKYSLDTLSRDSFFLREEITEVATKDNPRPNTTINNQIFRSREQLELFASNLQNQALQYAKAARLLDAKSRAITGLVTENNSFFNQPPKTPVTKPAKKPKPKSKKN